MLTQKPDPSPESKCIWLFLLESVYENHELDSNILVSYYVGVIGDSMATSVRRRSNCFRPSSRPIRKLCSHI